MSPEPSTDAGTRAQAATPYRFRETHEARDHTIIVGGASSENREYLPVAIVDREVIVSNLAFAIYDGPIWTFSIIGSRLHQSWIAAVCGKLESRYRYANTLGWHTFPVPTLTDKDKVDLEDTARGILFTRAFHVGKTIADLYDPDEMPDDLREAHRKNDEMIEKIYIGRTFRNDTERLEHLFQRYSKMVAAKVKADA